MTEDDTTDPTEDADLKTGLADLSRLVMGQGPRGLPDMLTHIAEFALHAIPDGDGVGLTLLESGEPATIVSTADFVRAVDRVQYDLAEGPCITACQDRRTVRSGALGEDSAWPRFGPRAAALGIASALSFPLLGADGVLGSVNVYARKAHAFDERSEALGEMFVLPAASSVQNAQALHQARRLADQLQVSLASRVVIDRAMGILMSRSGCTADEAFGELRTRSRAENHKVSLIAQQVVDEAVRRARTRRAAR